MRMISPRISVNETNFFSLVILGKVESWKESMLFFWLMAWTFCGSVFLYYYLAPNELQYSIFLLIVLSFWLYFEIRIAKVFIWRRRGYEQIVFKEDDLSIKNVFFKNAKAKNYALDGIASFEQLPYNPGNFFSFVEHSFWTIGGQSLFFEYNGKKVQLAMQLNDDEIKKVLSLLNGQLKRSKKEIRSKARSSK